MGCQPLRSIGSIQSLQPIQPIQPVQLVQPIYLTRPIAPSQSVERNADSVTPPSSPTLSTATTATGTLQYLQGSDSTSFQLSNPDQKPTHAKDHCNFTPLLPLLSQCGYSLKSEWLRAFNYSNKPIVINRRARLGSVLKPP